MEHDVSDGFNDGFVQMMYENWLASPESVSTEWQQKFAGGPPASAPAPAAATSAPATATAPAAAPANGTTNGASKPAPAAPEGAQLMKGPAAGLVRNMNESLTVPTATTIRTVGVGMLDAKRRELNSKLADQGRKLSFTHIVALALVEAWRGTPVMGHTFAEIGGKPYRMPHEHLNFGLAVDVEKPDGSRGLMVPVIKAADAMTIAQFVERYDELVSVTRAGKLALDDMMGTTMTLTNPGGLGTSASVPRLMSGQGTIVATGSIAFPPEFAHLSKERIAELGVGKVMTITSTYDHRVIQGAESGAFLRTVDELLQGKHDFYERILAELSGAAAPAPAVAKAEQISMPTEPVPLPGQAAPIATATVSASSDQAASIAAATQLVGSYRSHGHLAAQLDPLGSEPVGDPALDPAGLGLTDEIMRSIPASILKVGVAGETLADALPRLRETYCGTMAYEIEHIADHGQRSWLRQMIESGTHRHALTPDEKLALLKRLTQVEAFERFVRRAYLAQKQFSIEGVDMLVPMLDELVSTARRGGAEEAILGMAHRGRLNVLTHILGRPYGAILREFEAESRVIEGTEVPGGGTGDVKYHQGASGVYDSMNGAIRVSLCPNPSHLEAVNPVVEGRTRAEQTQNDGTELHHDPTAAVAVLIHGDAAFAGQGIVPETLNLQSLPGYSTGGTIHIIANNQLGFTTQPTDGRSTRYSSDLAKGYDIPIIHVNADDPENCLAAVRLAVAYRDRFGEDAMIDLIGYRRHGHNETDEPAYTQPRMYEAIKSHQRVRELFAADLVAQGLITAEAVQQLYDEIYQHISAVHDRDVLQAGDRAPSELDDPTGDIIELREADEPETRLDDATVRRLVHQLGEVPSDFTVHPKLAKQLDRRQGMPDASFDFGAAESVALGSLLEQGVGIRLTGQDCERGTFAHRHMMLHDVNSGECYAPIQHLPNATAALEVHNSPLSEAACLGYEYGYSVAKPDSLVMWEAQFGDFVNGAQIISDQFITSGMVKWGATSRLTLLLPHGYEGNGPEHSNARIARWLGAAAEGSIRVAHPTTSAQYFHLLRRQGLIGTRRPLIVMTPKGLLRAPFAMSPIGDFTNGRFEWVLEDPVCVAEPQRRAEVTRLVLCSGKVFYDMSLHAARPDARHVAIARMELLYPFPRKQLEDLIRMYPNLTEVLWVQEEPLNHGAFPYMSQRLPDALGALPLRYAGRPKRSSTSEGYTSVHLVEQDRIVREALA